MKNTPFGLLGIAQAIVDVLVDVSEEQLGELGMKKGSYGELTEGEQKVLLEKLISHKQVLVSGGSVANSVAAYAALGGTAGIVCRMSDDRFGAHFAADLESAGVATPLPIVVGGNTGICISLIAPDGERTMRTHLGIAKTLTKELLPEVSFKGAQWVLLEGYVLANGSAAPDLFFEAIERAHAAGAQVAFSCSDTWVVHAYPEAVKKIVSAVDLVFVNTPEAEAVTGVTGVEGAYATLKKLTRGLVMSCGASGVRVSLAGEAWKVPAFPCEPRDLTGAGDMLTGSFLYGLDQGLSVSHAARAACFMARAVIGQVGARLRADHQALWQEAIAQPIKATAL